MAESWPHLLFLTLSTVAILGSSMYIRPFPRSIYIRPNDHRNGSDPQQVRISLAGKDHMWISWITWDHRNARSTVEYGRAAGRYENSRSGAFSTYRYMEYHSGQIHGVKIGPLEPNTIYYYRCGGRGHEFRFKTPPDSFPIEFVVIGDLGQTEWSKLTLQQINAYEYDVVLLPGDLSYADGDQRKWDSFGHFVEPYASFRPWMVGLGDHEIETIPIFHPSYFKAYNARWQMPYRESGSETNFYYSFDIAGAHVVMLASYIEYHVDSHQYKWLQSDLARVDRTRTPWIFVFMHVPWYNSNLSHRMEGESMRLALEETLYKARVDMVIGAHIHSYERFTRAYNNDENACGPVYVTIGDGGNVVLYGGRFNWPYNHMSVIREPSFGHGRLRVMNRTHAQFSWYRNEEDDSSMADWVWLESLSSSPTCRPH